MSRRQAIDLESDDTQRNLRTPTALGRRQLRQQQRKLNVLLRGEDRQEIVGLKHEADVL